MMYKTNFKTNSLQLENVWEKKELEIIKHQSFSNIKHPNNLVLGLFQHGSDAFSKRFIIE